MEKLDRKKLNTLERVFKGVASRRRIAILEIIDKNSDYNLDEIAKSLKTNYQTTAEHVRRLRIAGLINDGYKGKSKSYDLSPFGKKILKIVRTFLD